MHISNRRHQWSVNARHAGSCIDSGIRICIPLGSANCTWCGPKEEHFRILCHRDAVMRMMSMVYGGGAQNMASA
jgi:hypothetical protein